MFAAIYLKTSPPSNVMVPLHWVHGFRLIECFNHAGIDMDAEPEFWRKIKKHFVAEKNACYKAKLVKAFGN